MDDLTLMDVLPWIAVIALNAGYWVQIVKIHLHREVRDIAISSYIYFSLAYVILSAEAYHIDSTIFLVKNLTVLVSTIILIGQVRYHRNDEWHDEDSPHCECDNEIEDNWTFCPDCGNAATGRNEGEASQKLS